MKSVDIKNPSQQKRLLLFKVVGKALCIPSHTLRSCTVGFCEGVTQSTCPETANKASLGKGDIGGALTSLLGRGL